MRAIDILGATLGVVMATSSPATAQLSAATSSWWTQSDLNPIDEAFETGDTTRWSSTQP